MINRCSISNLCLELCIYILDFFFSTDGYKSKSGGVLDESTLQAGQKCCHIVLFSKGVHIWTSTMVGLEHIFPNFLHNMVDHNTKNSIENKIHFPNLYCVIPKYICGKKNVCHCVQKNANIFKKWLKWFSVFMKFIISIKHCDSIWLE